MKTVERKIPVIFEKLTDFDSRFMSVKIWLMHLGKNLNGSYFSKDVVEAAIPSLSNTPILGYVMGKNGEEDFSEHKSVLSKNPSTGRYELKYIGQAYGVIPETNYAQFEMKVCEDGVEREFLTVQGLMWNKWDTPEEIMLRDLVKNQSMELDENFEGYFDQEDKLFHYTNIKFFGSCILGEDILPAMANSEIEVNFSMANPDWKKEIQDNMEQFKNLYASYQSSEKDNDIYFKDKDGENMKEKLLAILANYSLTEETAIEKGIDLANFQTDETLVDFEAAIQFAIKEVVIQETPVEPEVTPNFSLTGNQIVQEFQEELAKSTQTDSYGYVYQDLWFVDYIPDQNIVIAYDCNSGYLVGLNYTVVNDDVAIDFASKKEFKVQYVPVTEPVENATEFSLVSKAFSASQLDRAVTKGKEDAVAEVATKFAQVEAEKQAIEAEIVELRQFKAAKNAEEKDLQISELFAQFSEQLTEEEIAEARVQFSQMDVSEIEKELFAMIGKKAAKFSRNAKQVAAPTSVKIPVFQQQDPGQSEGYAYIIEKAIAKKSQ